MRALLTAALFATVACAAQAAETYTVVPLAERLTFAGVVADASVEVQVAMAIMIFATVASAAVWAMSLGKVYSADTRALSVALTKLRIVRSAAVPMGCLTASYVLFASFIGLANVRPTPSMGVVAPGLAEATLAILLGLLAATVAVVAERHLEGRMRSAAGC